MNKFSKNEYQQFYFIQLGLSLLNLADYTTKLTKYWLKKTDDSKLQTQNNQIQVMPKKNNELM